MIPHREKHHVTVRSLGNLGACSTLRFDPEQRSLTRALQFSEYNGKEASVSRSLDKAYCKSTQETNSTDVSSFRTKNGDVHRVIFFSQSKQENVPGLTRRSLQKESTVKGRPVPFSLSYMVGRNDKRTNNRTLKKQCSCRLSGSSESFLIGAGLLTEKAL